MTNYTKSRNARHAARFRTETRQAQIAAVPSQDTIGAYNLALLVAKQPYRTGPRFGQWLADARRTAAVQK